MQPRPADGRPRVTQFDKSLEGYEGHIKSQHNMWSYLYFLYGLQKKQQTEYNGLESYVYDKLLAEDISWFPFEKSGCLGVILVSAGV
jgi:hypothetical protein